MRHRQNEKPKKMKKKGRGNSQGNAKYLKFSRIVHEELKRKQFNAKEYAQSIKDRIESIPDLNFAGCHTLSKGKDAALFPYWH